MSNISRIGMRIGIGLLIILIILLSLALIVLPQLGIYLVEHEYNKQSSEHHLDIGSLNVNVLTGSLILKDVQANEGKNINYIGQLEVDIGLWELFSHTLYIENITLDNIKLNIAYKEDSLTIAGYNIDLSSLEEQTPVESDVEQNTEQEIEWKFKLAKFAISNTQLGVTAMSFNSELSLDITSLSLGEFGSYGGFSAPLKAQLSVNNAKYQEWVSVVEPIELNLNGMIHWRNNQVELESDISAKNLFVQLAPKGSVNLEQLKIQGIRANQQKQSVNNLTITGLNIITENLSKNKLPAPIVALKSLSLSELKHHNGAINLDTLKLNGLHLAPAEYPKIKQSTLPIANIQTIIANDVSFKDKKVVLNRLDISELNLASKEADILRLKHYVANNTRFHNNRLELGEHHFQGLEAWLKRNKNGEFTGLPKSQASSSENKDSAKTNKSREAQKEQTQAPEPPFSLAMTQLKQTDDSFIYFIDESVNPKVKKDIRIETLQIKNLDTANKSQPVVFEMLGHLDKFNSISVKGDLALKEKMDGNILLHIDQLDLPPLSAYVHHSIGYNVNHGMLGLNLDSKIKAGKLTGKGKLTLANADFDPADKEIIKRLSKQLSIPLDTALDLLSDGDKKVEIDFPIEGSVSNPSVGISTIFTQIAQDVLVKATITYLKYFFNPFGAVIVAAEVGDNLLFSINLKPLKFSADSKKITTLTLSHKHYLDKVAAMMKKQTSLQLKVCPFMLEHDGWTKQATDIANEAKAYLSEKEKTLSSRIFVCTPKIGKSNQLLLGF